MNMENRLRLAVQIKDEVLVENRVGAGLGHHFRLEFLSARARQGYVGIHLAECLYILQSLGATYFNFEFANRFSSHVFLF